MYKQEQIKPYEGTGDKGKLVEEMFDNIAPTYDTLNHRLSWDIDKGWRKKAIRRLAPFSPKKMLDIATGTGDFAILAAQMLHPDQLIGADISEGMMEIGRQKVRQLGLENTISFAKEDCLNLSFQDESFDAAFVRVPQIYARVGPSLDDAHGFESSQRLTDDAPTCVELLREVSFRGQTFRGLIAALTDERKDFSDGVRGRLRLFGSISLFW